jgi:CPA2 family monovalent cation:H+ antiporter-2
MAFVARWNSRELFFLATTALAVGVGYLTFLAGLSMALGAFVAGLVVNESEYAHQALSDVMPLRDLFGMVFFVSVGMLLDPVLAWRQLGMLTLLVVTIAIAKAVILGGVVRLFGYWNVIPLAVALTLFQVGEFAFVLARVGLSTGAISQEVYSLTLNTAIATMALTPVVSGLTHTIYTRFWRRRDRETVEPINLPEAGLSDHIIIAGAGRVGGTIARALAQAKLPFVAIEFDDRRVQQAKKASLPLIYGDAAQTVVLEAANIESARVMLVTVPSFPDVRSIVMAARRLRPDLPIVARADGAEAMRDLYALGIQEVTSPELEAGIEMAQQALMNFHVPAHDVLGMASAIRREQYGHVNDRGSNGLAVMSQISDMARQLDFIWVGLPPDSPFIGQSLEELRIRSRTGVSVVGIIRDGGLTPNPDGSARLDAGDLVAVLGTRDQIARFEQAMR